MGLVTIYNKADGLKLQSNVTVNREPHRDNLQVRRVVTPVGTIRVILTELQQLLQLTAIMIMMLLPS